MTIRETTLSFPSLNQMYSHRLLLVCNTYSIFLWFIKCYKTRVYISFLKLQSTCLFSLWMLIYMDRIPYIRYIQYMYLALSLLSQETHSNSFQIFYFVYFPPSRTHNNSKNRFVALRMKIPLSRVQYYFPSYVSFVLCIFCETLTPSRFLIHTFSHFLP